MGSEVVLVKLSIRMKKDEVWALWGVIWTRNEWDMTETRIGNEGSRENEKFLISDSKSGYI